jgi:hypothetical protein
VRKDKEKGGRTTFERKERKDGERRRKGKREKCKKDR